MNDQSPPFKLGTSKHPSPPEPTASDRAEVRSAADSPSAPYLRRRAYSRAAGFEPPTVPNVQQGEQNRAPGEPLGRKG